MRILVGMGIDVGLVSGECVEERHVARRVGVDDAVAAARPVNRVVRRHATEF